MTCLNLHQLKVWIPLLGLCLLMACSKEDDTPIARINLESFSPEDQSTIGQTLAETVVNDAANFPQLNLANPNDQAVLENYLNRLIQTVAITAPVANRNFYNWEITIVHDDEDRNLFATPGGHFFIYTGLLKFLESESELIAILAHEMRYVDQNLLIEGLKSEFGGNTLGDIVLGKQISDINNMALWLRDVSFSELDVLESDAFAIDVLCPFRYYIGGLKDVVQRVKDNTEADVAWMDKRPSAINRLDEMEVLLSNCGNFGGADFSDRYHEMLAKLP
ncbi:MAG: M48 family metalloprotease [Bacteroidota bacterium]